MNISLTPELEKLVNKKVKSGLYQTASEVVREGLRLMKERDDEVRRLRADIQEGFDAIDRGDFTEYDVDSLHRLSDEVKATGRKRLAEDKAKPARR
jgi:antitoxin ParD1/3/4